MNIEHNIREVKTDKFGLRVFVTFVTVNQIYILLYI